MDRPLHRVEIDWVDITGHSGWHDIDDVRDLPLKHMTSVGYLISRANDAYRIATTISPESSTCGDPLLIPRRVIDNVRMLKIKDYEL